MKFKEIYVFIYSHFRGPLIDIQNKESKATNEHMLLLFPYDSQVEQGYTVNLCYVEWSTKSLGPELKVLYSKYFDDYNDSNKFCEMIDDKYIENSKILQHLNIDFDDLDGELFTAIFDNKKQKIINYYVIQA